MEFTVPQFIEREAKIVGPLTFKQFIYIGTAGALSLFLYFTVPFFLFIVTAGILLGIAFILAFFKIGKTSAPSFIVNFFSFLFKPKIYLWKKKTSTSRFLVKKEPTREKVAPEELELKVSRGSKLDELFTRLETK